MASPLDVEAQRNHIRPELSVAEKFNSLLAQFDRPDAKPRPPVVLEEDFARIRHQVLSLITSSFKIDHPPHTWIAIRKELVATLLNDTVSQASACLLASGSSRQQSQSKIPMPSGEGIDCSSDRDCESSRRCSFEASRDTRDCSACLLSRPVVCAPRICAFGGCVGGGCTGGGCIQRGNDPLCETAKAAQNQIYLADANLRKADCDRLRAMETTSCQVEELGKKGLCEAGKATLNALRKTGNFANIDVDAELRADAFSICLREFNLSPGLDRVAFAFDVDGKAQTSVDVRFTPLDVFGHLACQFPWRERQRFEAVLREPRIPIEAAVRLQTPEEKNPRLTFETGDTTIKARLSPGPTQFLLTSPYMTVSCAGFNLLKPIVIALTPFVQELRGDIDHKLEKREVSFDVPLPKADLAGSPLKFSLSQSCFRFHGHLVWVSL